jgi:undecaprenyl-diphosphatase
MLDFMLQLDRDLFLFLNSLHTPWLDPVMFLISDRFAWVPLYLWLLYISVKRYGWRAIYFIICIALLIALSDQVTGFMKSYFQRFRPSRDENLGDLVHIVNNYRGGKYGFVSSHAANAFALAIFVSQIFRKKVKYLVPVMLTYAVLNAYSRIYLGVHYPADVIVGGLIGIMLAMIMIPGWRYVSRQYIPSKE